MAKKFDLSSVVFAPRPQRGSRKGDDRHAFIRTYEGGKIVLYLTASLVSRIGVDDWEYVLFGYDKSTQSVILKKAAQQTDNARLFAKINSLNSARQITIEAFVNYFSINTEKEVVYDVVKYGKDILALTPITSK
jgi:hypothetical protein